MRMFIYRGHEIEKLADGGYMVGQFRYDTPQDVEMGIDRHIDRQIAKLAKIRESLLDSRGNGQSVAEQVDAINDMIKRMRQV